MSTVKANNVQVGQSGTATNNFTLYQPSSPDGTVRLAVGNSGATSADVLTANSSGNVGIGTTSPSAKLDVSSSSSGVTAGDFVVDTSNKIVYVGRQSSTNGDNSTFIVRNRVGTEVLKADASTQTVKTAATISVGGATPSTSGAGITFPATQSASSDANTLDDYEEGTFTPTVLGSTTAGTGTYTYQVGTYVKVGQLVSVSCLIEITNHTGTGNLRFGNLPFATSNSNSLNRYGGAIGSLNNLALTASNVALLHAQNNSTEMLMLQYPVGGGGQTDVPMDTSFGISFTFTYRCSA